jgi:hypothetical protein
MVLPNKGDLKAKILPDIQDFDQVQRLENLKSILMKVYKEVRLNNRKAHQKNKAYYDKLRRGNLRLMIRFFLPCYRSVWVNVL